MNRPARSTRVTFWIGFAVVFVVMSATALPLCGQMFRCGCSMAGAASHCNIHHAGGPHCPWCAGGGKAFGWSFLAVLPGVAGCVYAAARWRRSVVVAAVAGTVAYALIGVAAGWVTARAMAYPTWFGLPV
jgi:hypothetical protein